jgi:hypothetical protein
VRACNLTVPDGIGARPIGKKRSLPRRSQGSGHPSASRGDDDIPSTPKRLDGEGGSKRCRTHRCGSRIFFSITARVTDSVEIATPNLAASAVSEMRRGTSKYPSVKARRKTSC